MLRCELSRLDHYDEDIDRAIARVSGSEGVQILTDKSGKMLDKSRSHANELTDFVQAFTGPLVDLNGKFVRYESYLNKTQFDYIVENELYNQEGQIEFVSNKGQQIRFPANQVAPEKKHGSMGIKLAWKQALISHGASVVFSLGLVWGIRPRELSRSQYATVRQSTKFIDQSISSAKVMKVQAHNSGRGRESPGRGGDLMGYTITVEGDGPPMLVQQSDTTASPAFKALRRWLEDHSRKNCTPSLG